MRNIEQVNWKEVRKEFEKEMQGKLGKLPGHRKIPRKLKALRDTISHELPETSPTKIYSALIRLLLRRKQLDLKRIRDRYLEPELAAEKKILKQYKKEFIELKESAFEWVKENISEEEMKRLWQQHKTWLPRRYTVYKRHVSCQKIAADTLARFALIKMKI